MKCRALPFNKQYLGGENKKPQSLSIFAKGFPKNWTHEDLYKVFEKFGKISSAKVVVDAGLESRGYGFVSMDSPESVQKAIDGLNEKTLLEIGCEGEDLQSRLSVKEFVTKIDRDGTQKPRCLTNLYVKNFPAP